MPQHRYSAIPRVLCFLRHGERWLLIHRAADRRLYPGLYNGIGGHVEPGEGILAAARRELQEEAGVRSPDLRLRGVLHETEGQTGVLVFVFSGTTTSLEVSASGEGTPVWVTTGEMARLPLVPDVPAILARLIAMRPEDPPFTACSTSDGLGHQVVTVFEEGHGG